MSDKISIGNWEVKGWKATVLGLFLLIGWHSIFIYFGYVLAQ